MLLHVAGVDFFVEDQGSGSPILLVHGFPLDHTMWAAQVAELSKQYRVITPDLRGFGNSGGAQDKITMEDFADDLHAILETLRVEEPITYCGLSMGGYIGWQFATKYPERVARLVVCDSKAEADSEEVIANRLALAERVVEDGPEFMLEGMIPKLFAEITRQSKPEVVAATEDVICKTDPYAIAGASRGMAARPDMTEALSKIECPVLLSCGVEDSLTPPELMKAMQPHFPHARYEQVMNAGHMAPLENPDAFNATLLQFLGETDV